MLTCDKESQTQPKRESGGRNQKANARIPIARRLMLDKEIDATEYREIKEEKEGEIVNLERKIKALTTSDSDRKEQNSFCFDLLQNLPKYFAAADYLPDNKYPVLYFRKNSFFQKYRTIMFRNIVSLIFKLGRLTKEEDKRKAPKIRSFSLWCPTLENYRTNSRKSCSSCIR